VGVGVCKSLKNGLLGVSIERGVWALPSSELEVDKGVNERSKEILLAPNDSEGDVGTSSGINERARRAIAGAAEAFKLERLLFWGDFFSGVVNGDFGSCASKTGTVDINPPGFMDFT